MDKLTRTEINCTTGETTIIELTATEIAELDQMRAKQEEMKAKADAEAEALAQLKASALAKLAELGLTEDEAKAIAG